MPRQAIIDAPGALHPPRASAMSNWRSLVSGLTAVLLQAMAGAGKQRQGVRASGLLCYWAESELGMSLTDLSGRLKVCVPTVSIAVQRGMKIAEHEKLDIGLLLNAKI